MIQPTSQPFLNKSFYYLLLFTLVFGVLFYDTLRITFTDELCAVAAVSLYFLSVYRTPQWRVNRFFLVTLGVFLFYLAYSLAFGVGRRSAIVSDFIVQLKPYLAFFAIYGITPKLENKQKVVIKQLCTLFSIYVFCLGVILHVNYPLMEILIKHPSRIATASSILALLYLYCSEYTRRDKFIFLLLLSAGLLSTRAKFFGFYVICAFAVFYIDRKFRLEFNLKNTTILLFALAGIAVVAADKIYLYFVQGGFGDGRGEEDLYARMALYFFSLQVLTDYSPLGPGFGTYATFASGEYYSPLYAKYNMNIMYGLTESDPQFMADTYYPALAQFGYVGVVLFFLFWIFLTVRCLKSFVNGSDNKNIIIALLIIAFFLIECTSDSTLTHNRGLFMMMLLGMVFTEIRMKNIRKIR